MFGSQTRILSPLKKKIVLVIESKEYFGNMKKPFKMLQQSYNYFRLNSCAFHEMTLSLFSHYIFRF